ncbi:MAG: GntR family transcriptional regulator, partial [Chloroflexi bacterium]
HHPEEVLSAHVAHLLGCRIELDRRTQLPIIHFARRVCHLLEDALHFAHGALPRIGHRRHVGRRKLELALQRLRGGDAFECKRPRQLLRAAARGVGLHGFLPTGVGAQDLHRGGCLPFPGVQKRLFLAHTLSSLSRAEICLCRPRLRAPGKCITVPIHWNCDGTVFHDIDARSPIPLYVQIAERIRLAIATGTLGSAAPLPSVRQLAAELRVNPATIIQAYRDLEAQGFVEIRHGAGTFVRELAPGRRARERSQQASALVRKLVADARRSGVSLAELHRALEAELGVKTP